MPDEEVTPEQQLEAMQKQVTDLETENDKLRNKDMNFEKLRSTVKSVKDMNEEEKKHWTEKEQVLIDRIASAEQAIEAERSSKVLTWKDSALEKFAGDDEKTREKVLFHFDRFKEDVTDKAGIDKRMRECVILANSDQKEPLGIPMSSAGNPAPVTRPKTDFADSQEGAGLLASMGHVSPKKD